jgi:HPt (histidine-containing phosphotransfer) domain-containing protein
MPATDDLLRQQLARMRVSYLATLPSRLGEVEALWSRAGQGDAAALEAFCRKIHQLAGNAGTFGFPEVSRSAAAIDAIVGSAAREDTGLSAAEAASVGRELASLREAVRASGQADGP